eukprot:s1019_g10.t1
MSVKLRELQSGAAAHGRTWLEDALLSRSQREVRRIAALLPLSFATGNTLEVMRKKLLRKIWLEESLRVAEDSLQESVQRLCCFERGSGGFDAEVVVLTRWAARNSKEWLQQAVAELSRSDVAALCRAFDKVQVNVDNNTKTEDMRDALVRSVWSEARCEGVGCGIAGGSFAEDHCVHFPEFGDKTIDHLFPSLGLDNVGCEIGDVIFPAMLPNNRMNLPLAYDIAPAWVPWDESLTASKRLFFIFTNPQPMVALLQYLAVNLPQLEIQLCDDDVPEDRRSTMCLHLICHPGPDIIDGLHRLHDRANRMHSRMQSLEFQVQRLQRTVDQLLRQQQQPPPAARDR